VRFITASGAGGLTDTMARLLALHLAERLGQPVVVENRPGASETIAADVVAKSPADGHTLYLASEAALVLNAILRKTIPYDPQRDFTGISMVAESPYYLVVNPSVPASSLNELIALAKSQPGKLMFASTGPATMQHLLGEMLKVRAKVDIMHVPYKTSPQATLDLVAGRVDMMIQGGQTTLGHIRSGKLRGLAVTSATRHEEILSVPTMMEAGMADFVASSWFALIAPAGLSKPIVDRLNREVGELLRAPEARQKLAALGVNVIPSTPGAVGERVRKDFPLWTGVVREAGIEAE
jgi:tripartite-type tricarboxylate transporter receptor subunit TctC